MTGPELGRIVIRLRVVEILLWMWVVLIVVGVSSRSLAAETELRWMQTPSPIAEAPVVGWVLESGTESGVYTSDRNVNTFAPDEAGVYHYPLAIEEDTTTYYRMQSVNRDGPSVEWSNEMTRFVAAPEPEPKPDPPALVPSDSAAIQWTQPDGAPADTYQLLWSLTPDGNDGIDDLGALEPVDGVYSHTPTNITDEIHYYCVRGVNQSGKGDCSDTVVRAVPMAPVMLE